ncbi:DUF2777 family protein, partial [Bacillus mycoides]|uniref:DUF2777 family protein n=1 Tax=Bacillus mycoides TaxID=1405 RepID=UPI0024AE3EB7
MKALIDTLLQNHASPLLSIHLSLFDFMYCDYFFCFLTIEEACEVVNILLFFIEEMFCSLQLH